MTRLFSLRPTRRAANLLVVLLMAATVTSCGLALPLATDRNQGDQGVTTTVARGGPAAGVPGGGAFPPAQTSLPSDAPTVPGETTIPGDPSASTTSAPESDLIVPAGADPLKLSAFCTGAYAFALAGQQMDRATSVGDLRELPDQLRGLVTQLRKLLQFEEIDDTDEILINTLIAEVEKTADLLEADPESPENLRTFRDFAARVAPTIGELVASVDRQCN